jgi:hypothetical protein
MECVHVQWIAAPFDLRTRGRQDQARKVSNWSRWGMVAGEPFRIHKGCGTALLRNAKLGMNYVLRRVRQIHVNLFYAGLTKCALSQEQSHGNGKSYTPIPNPDGHGGDHSKDQLSLS